jgi:hypothetical protein
MSRLFRPKHKGIVCKEEVSVIRNGKSRTGKRGLGRMNEKGEGVDEGGKEKTRNGLRGQEKECNER